MKILISIFTAFLLAACHSTDYNTQHDERAYIQLNGDYVETEINVGDLKFAITEQTKSYNLNGKQVVKFEIPKGKHQLTIYKNNKVIIKKFILVSEGQTVEVTIP